ncbi:MULTISPECIES: hypothetical protein [unclassified Nostoc]|uniref:hypothetical protein n=1 Tax=unclassified Nostoc TaxID=2593658 RepID=UPI0025FDFBB3|nr:hypothetical protein [Nostoc sp. JL33]MBN3871208.1 hypothetical protein [Nostoc sp. JL33]
MSQEQLQELMNQTKDLSNSARLRLISYLLAEVKGANESTRKAAIARIRKRWEILPIQSSSQLQEWKEQGRL